MKELGFFCQILVAINEQELMLAKSHSFAGFLAEYSLEHFQYRE
jgi:hypothetical protein